MHQGVLFVTRKASGTGGMQRYSEDLWRGCLSLYGSHARRIAPGGSLASRIAFPLRAVTAGVLRGRKGDCIHFGDAALSPLAFLVKRICPSARVTVTACGLDITYPSRIYQWALRRTLPAMDAVVCISRATEQEVLRRGVPEERTIVIPCGAWIEGVPSRCEPPSGSPVLLTVGRLVERKGVAWFLCEVLPEMLRTFPGLRYEIVGTGKDAKLIKKIIQERALDEAVSLHGYVTDSERDTLLQNASCLVCPNVPVEGDMEGFGIVCVEAAARGVPVAAARLEGLQDAVDEGGTGRFFRPRDAEGCARVIAEMLRNPLDASSVARAAREKYSWSVLIQQYATHVFRRSP